MAYTKNTWQCGDVVTADKLNNIEDGIEQALECCGGVAQVMSVQKATPR